MIIGFHNPCAVITEGLIEYLREEIIKLSHQSGEISRAEVALKEEPGVNGQTDKVCEIRLAIYGDDLMTHGRAHNFWKAAENALKALKELVDQQVARRNEPPDITTSTVYVSE